MGKNARKYIMLDFPAIVLLHPRKIWTILLMQAAATDTLRERALSEVFIPNLSWEYA
jgi:hypothetical protein